MREFAIAVAKTVGGPGSIGFFVACSVVGLVMTRVGVRGRRVARVWMILLVVGYLVLSLPIVATAITDRLTTYRPLEHLSPLRGIKTLVVLDGDNRRGRVREAKRIFDAIAPDRVVVSGGEWMVDALREAGIPPDPITHESQSRNTQEQLLAVGGETRSGKAVLVASRLQMPRVAALAESLGLNLALASSAIDMEPPTSGVWLVIPTYVALRVSRDALYEHAALASRSPVHSGRLSSP